MELIVFVVQQETAHTYTPLQCGSAVVKLQKFKKGTSTTSLNVFIIPCDGLTICPWCTLPLTAGKGKELKENIGKGLTAERCSSSEKCTNSYFYWVSKHE